MVVAPPQSEVGVLLVDDERPVLQGLARMLRSQQGRWRLRFAESGLQALDQLAAEPADVVVSDIMMPGLSGDRFLKEVVARYPGTIRIVLSGQCDDQAILRTAGPAHQFLAKPCEAARLVGAIDRALDLRARMLGPEAIRLATGIESLPALPSIYAELESALANENAGLPEIAAIVARDVGLTAKLLQIANSAYFARRRTVTSALQALQFLGIDLVRALMLQQAVATRAVSDPACRAYLEWLNQCGLRTAFAARTIAEAEHMTPLEISYALMAGMLHDAGSVLLAGAKGRDYLRVVNPQQQRPAEAGPIDFCTREVKAFGASHADIGAYLCALWGLPDVVVEAVQLHHTPSLSPSPDAGVLLAVHVANALVQSRTDAAPDDSPGPQDYQLDMGFLERQGKAGRLPAWRKLVAPLVPAGRAR